MIQCPNCREMIPDDSAFCDQCGKELMWCPECGRPKRGTQCPVCGNDLIPGHVILSGAKDLKPDSSATPQNDKKEPRDDNNTPSTAPSVIPSAAPSVIPSAASVSPAPTKLVSPGLTLVLQPGPFGRRGGIWPELGTCQYVSGSHGAIGKTGDTWTITDNGSTNGTFVNGARLAAGAPVQLKAGDKVRIATLDFTVQ
ncbi:MAG: FHA domain-containing protein [Bacteroidales bacterium]|nr:FHA domain-containing protein [Bacteroidales bacterium]